MKFSKGDRILLKRTGEEGHVIDYINKQMLEVEVDGTVFPVHADDIDHPYMKWFTEQKTAKKPTTPPEQLPVERIIERKQRLARGVYLSFVPVFVTIDMEDVVDHLKVYLLNEMAQPIKLAYDMRMAAKSVFSHEGTLHAFGNLYLHNVSYDDMNDQPRFQWQLTDAQNTGMAVAEGVLRIRPARLFEHINELMTGGQPSFAYTLIEDFLPAKVAAPLPLPEVAAAKTPLFPGFVTLQNIEAARYEIDLHIEELPGHHKNMTNAEIVTLQLNTLHRYLQLAIVHRQQRMIVIHGLGKGKLRDEVHTILKKIPEVGRFKNEWSGKYGFGATEIYFRY